MPQSWPPRGGATAGGEWREPAGVLRTHPGRRGTTHPGGQPHQPTQVRAVQPAKLCVKDESFLACANAAPLSSLYVFDQVRVSLLQACQVTRRC